MHYRNYETNPANGPRKLDYVFYNIYFSVCKQNKSARKRTRGHPPLREEHAGFPVSPVSPPSKTPEPAKNWAQPTLSPIFRPVDLGGCFHPHCYPEDGVERVSTRRARLGNDRNENEPGRVGRATSPQPPTRRLCWRATCQSPPSGRLRADGPPHTDLRVFSRVGF